MISAGVGNFSLTLHPNYKLKDMQDVNRTKLVLVEQKKGGVRDVDNIVEEQQETQLF